MIASLFNIVCISCARRCSQAAVNRRQKLSLCFAPKHLRLYDFVKQRHSRPPTSTSAVNLRLGTVSVGGSVSLLSSDLVLCNNCVEIFLNWHCVGGS